MSPHHYTAPLFCVLLAFQTSNASIVHFPEDSQGWKAAAKQFESIDFTGFPHATLITTQYSGVGLTFSNTVFINQGAQYSDGWGLFGNNGINFQFDTPHHAIAVEYLGAVAFKLFSDGNLIATSLTFHNVKLGIPVFAGIISDVPFDEVHLFKPNPPFDNNIISIDTLYWAMPIPAPGALPVLALGLLAVSRRRRV